MSKKLLSFLLSELETVRLICHNKECEMTVEMSIDNFIRGKADPLHCRFCRAELTISDKGAPPLSKLADALADLRMLSKKYQVEFVLADNSSSVADSPAKS